MIEKKIQETKMFNYLIQLIEHPIFRIPTILLGYFLSIFPDKSFKL